MSLTIARIWLLVFLCIGMQALQARAEVHIEQNPDQNHCRLEVQAAVLDDPQGELDISQASAPGLETRFQPYDGKLISLSGNPNLKWLRIRLRCLAIPGAVPGRWLLELGLPDRELVQLFGPYSGQPGQYRLLDSPDSRSGRSGLLPYPRFVHSLVVRPEKWTTYYVRIAPFGLTVTSMIIWQEDLFQRNALTSNMLFGLLFGIMLSMTCYNLFLFLYLKRKIYLVYVIYIFSIFAYCFILDGYASVLFGISNLDLQALEWCFLGISIIFATWFCQKFLNTLRYTPRGHWVMVSFQIIALLIIVLGLLEDHNAAVKLSMAQGALGPLFLLIVGIIRCRQGYGAAKFYLLASLSFCLGTLIYLLWLLDVLPQAVNGELLFTLGPTVESVLLSFALADRIKSLENEKLFLAQSQAHYKKASQMDGLTGLFNKGHFMKSLDVMLKSAAKTGQPLSYAILDIDNFKKFNDTHGHQLGDEVLRSMGRVIRKELRGPDIAGRYGGEEFSLVFPNSSAAQAIHAAERIRESFAAQVFQLSGARPGISATLSLGLAQYKPGEQLGRIDRAGGPGIVPGQKIRQEPGIGWTISRINTTWGGPRGIRAFRWAFGWAAGPKRSHKKEAPGEGSLLVSALMPSARGFWAPRSGKTKPYCLWWPRLALQSCLTVYNGCKP